MDERVGPHLWGRERRYVLTELLWERGPMTVAELVAAVAAEGWWVGGRPSKTISDALRWEIAHGRVVRLGRGRYGPGRMPKQTKSWIRCRNRRTREEARAELTAQQEAAQETRWAAGRIPGHRSVAVAPPSPERSTGPTHPTHPTHPTDPTARPPHPTGPADPPAEGRTRPAVRHRPGDDEIVVAGGGWSEEDDAAEDELLRQRLLSTLRHPPLR